MRALLAILCALVALAAIAGAAMLVSYQISGDSGAAALALIPAAIAVLNLLVLRALFNPSQGKAWAFYLLAAIDVIAALGMAKFWSAIAFMVGDFWAIAAPAIAVLLVKAVLSLLVARNLPAA